jgi:hypothetical protein
MHHLGGGAKLSIVCHCLGPKHKKTGSRTGRQPVLQPDLLATCFTWLQAGRPNHHGISCPLRLVGACVNRRRLSSMVRTWRQQGAGTTWALAFFPIAPSARCLTVESLSPAGRLMPTRFSRRASISGSAQGLPRPRQFSARARARSPTSLQFEHARDRPVGGAVLETGCVYIVPLLESLALPREISASANPKSSTGRLDIFTRVMTDHGQEFDKIAAGYPGPLYLEVSPRTFPIVVRAPVRACRRSGSAPTGVAGRDRAAGPACRPRRWSPRTIRSSGGRHCRCRSIWRGRGPDTAWSAIAASTTRR